MVSWLAGLNLVHRAACYFMGDKSSLIAIANQSLEGFQTILKSVVNYMQNMIMQKELIYLPYDKVFADLPPDDLLLQQEYAGPDQVAYQTFLEEGSSRRPGSFAEYQIPF